ncbi:hypothetical protein IB277_31825 [Ensifer sp. ENS07]|uniref:hypothetical protein n=1 Tax=Ensifer sp. ENS07 TaxID=2769274 RepID=UPI001780E0C2|nr:hypothetical protein [Ensifer sp. ENS07]MBD9640891.1 hypothetical protein [Ensifer sp. ENS07]
MQVYDRQIAVTNQGDIFPAKLKVIRLPGSWYAVIWESPERYASFSQAPPFGSEGFEHVSERDFLDRVQLVASFSQGIDFEFEDGI